MGSIIHFDRLIAAVQHLSPVRKVVLALAIAATLVEIGFRLFAPRSKAYAQWTAGLEAIGGFWTAVLLSIVYFSALAVVNVAFRLSGKDPMDRSLLSAPSFWKAHEPNPLDPEGSARYQF